MGVVALGEIFGLDQHHVDGAGTFLLAGLARHAKIHGGGEARVAERVIAIIAVQRRLERGDARFGGMGGIMGDAIARAHHAAALALAFAVVHAHGHRLGVIAAAARRDAGIGVADAVGVIARPVQMRLHACSRLAASKQKSSHGAGQDRARKASSVAARPFCARRPSFERRHRMSSAGRAHSRAAR